MEDPSYYLVAENFVEDLDSWALSLWLDGLMPGVALLIVAASIAVATFWDRLRPARLFRWRVGTAMLAVLALALLIGGLRLWERSLNFRRRSVYWGAWESRTLQDVDKNEIYLKQWDAWLTQHHQNPRAYLDEHEAGFRSYIRGEIERLGVLLGDSHLDQESRQEYEDRIEEFEEALTGLDEDGEIDVLIRAMSAEQVRKSVRDDLADAHYYLILKKKYDHSYRYLWIIVTPPPPRPESKLIQKLLEGSDLSDKDDEEKEEEREVIRCFAEKPFLPRSVFDDFIEEIHSKRAGTLRKDREGEAPHRE